MRFLYLTAKFLPYWAIPLGLIFAEVGLILKRRGLKRAMKRSLACSALFFLLTLCFFVFRWDRTLYPWLRATFFGLPAGIG